MGHFDVHPDSLCVDWLLTKQKTNFKLSFRYVVRQQACSLNLFIRVTNNYNKIFLRHSRAGRILWCQWILSFFAQSYTQEQWKEKQLSENWNEPASVATRRLDFVGCELASGLLSDTVQLFAFVRRRRRRRRKQRRQMRRRRALIIRRIKTVQPWSNTGTRSQYL